MLLMKSKMVLLMKTQPNSARLTDFDKERIDISNFHFSLNPDAFSGQEPQTEAEKEEWARDEQEVRLASEFLQKTVLPELIHDLKEGGRWIPNGRPITESIAAQAGYQHQISRQIG